MQDQDEILEGFRLAPQQERLWSVGGEAGAPFWAQCAVDLAGRLDAGLLRRAVEAVVGRHEILRTALRSLHGMQLPLQVIRSEPCFDFEVHDAFDREPEEQMLRALSASGSDLSAGFPLRVTLVRFSDGTDRLSVLLSSLFMDEAGLDVLLRQIGASYAALQGGETELEPDVQFADLVEWQREILDMEESREGIERWRRIDAELEGLEPRLPFEAPAVSGASFDPRHLVEPVAADVVEAIDRLARRRGLEPSSFYLSVWQVLLARLCRETRLALAVRCEGRRYEELAGVMGLFARYLPIISDLDGALSLETVWGAAVRDQREAENWQECFPASPKARMPSFGFDAGDLGTHRIGGLEGCLTARTARLEAFTLRLSCLRRGASLSTVLEYDGARIAQVDARRLLGWLHRLLADAAARPGEAAGDLVLLDEGELGSLWSALAGEVEERPPVCIHDLFARQAAESPGAVACQEGDERLTYAELDSRANRLARHLRRLGVGPDQSVGVCLERSLDMIVVLLGVFKAGGGYFPLDPSYPPAHLEYLLVDAAPQVVVAQDHLVERLRTEVPRPTLVRLVADEQTIAAQGDRPLVSGAGPDHLAYVIYTSGSTGRPKGVMVSHRAILNRLLWMQSAFDLGPGDRVLLKTQIAFDASVWEIFATLLAGATLVIARPDGHRDPAYLVREIREQGVTILQLVPSMLRILLREPGLESCLSLRWVFSGGEALPAALAGQLRSRLKAGMVNLYGPTEVSIDSSFRIVRGEETGAIIPLGSALPNLRLHILDERQNPVPPGVAGELCVGGVGVARGYLGRPDLTADRFVPDPFAGAPGWKPGARLYRTGDLSRLDADGAVEFLGRIDHQVKIRGFRVEPREIEALLAAHPAVRDVVVLAREDEPGDRRLVAYAVPGQPVPNAADLRLFLEQKLPEHMVPSAYILLDAFPLTPNGKLDRQALPSPERQGGAVGEPAAPRDPVEATLALFWAEVLSLPAVGAHDNFFELGGHSLLATQIISRVRDAFGSDLPLRILFEAPTPAALASRIGQERRGGAVALPPLEPAPRARHLPLSFAQQRLWFIDQLVPGTTAYNLSIALRFRGILDVSTLGQALGEIPRRHESLRTVFAEIEGEAVQIIRPGDPRPMVQIDLSGLPEGAREPESLRLAAVLVGHPFDLSRGPLFRAVLLRIDPFDHLGVLVTHHIVSDGWSTGVLLNEMSVLYSAFVAGRSSPLPDLPIQYTDFAVWQRRWLQGELLETHLEYWRRHLVDLPILALATDRPRPAVQTFRGRRIPVAFPAVVMARHSSFARSRGITPYMTLLSAFSALLLRLTEQREIVVGSPIANRNRLELEGLIGFFVNALVLRIDAGGNPGFLQLQERVREVALNAAVYQDLPFEKLVESLQPDRDLSRSPLFQIVLAFQNTPMKALDLPGLQTVEQPLDGASAKFDLTFDLSGTKDDGIGGWLEYNTDLFDGVTMARLAASFAQLLRATADDPDRPILDLPVWSEAERHQVTAEWNDTRSLFCGAESIPRLVERQVYRTPEAVAVLSDEGTLSYREMNGQANRIAHRLRTLGVVRGELVGVFLNRSREMVPALLGVLKSGGAYVPLDPGFPPERLRWILKTLEIRTLVTQSGLLRVSAEVLRGLPRLAELVCVDKAEDGELAVSVGRRMWAGPSLAGLPDCDLLLPLDGDDLAYIIFTSGSTGTPKGVMVRHRPVVNLLDWVNRTYAVGPGDQLLFITSLCFDLSVYDVFGLLAAGGSVRVVSERDVHEPDALIRLLYREPITLWDSAPAALQQLVPLLPVGDQGARLRQVFLSGDWIPVTLPDRVRLAFPGARITALGGATEATVWSNSFPVGRVEQHWPSIPYGRPIPNARYHVLDSPCRPVPIGVPGDLWIGGECLAAGYCADPVQTAEKFVPDPFGRERGGRLYRTGDRARFLADGNLEFLGRLDHQVKIRGFRIELGEIETVLARHPGVREAVLLAREDRPGERRLVAYVVPSDAVPALSELRDHLRERLPDYMIPAAWMFLPALPVTENGKLDRRALPSPDRLVTDERLTPRTSSEMALADLWREILGRERIGVEDNFFELGGHSLLATQLSARIRAIFSVQMPLRELFVFPTLAEMAARVEELALATSDPQNVDDLLDLLEGLDEEAAAELVRRGGLAETFGEGVA